MSADGELMLTFLAAYAQEESRSVSENCKWRIRKQFEQGIQYSSLAFGYKLVNGELKVEPSEAKIVVEIFNKYLSGKGYLSIAHELNNAGIKTRFGNKWSMEAISCTLRNYTYTGNLILQKTFRENHITKKRRINKGELKKYHVENSHEPIINPIEFEWVQVEIQRRKELGKKYSGKSIFSTKLICADCGEFYGAKVWQSNTKYRKTILQCNSKFKGDVKCDTPTLTEQDIKERFIKAYNRLAYNRDALLADCRLMQKVVSDYSDIDVKLNELYQESEVIAELTKRCIEENSLQAINQEEYLKRYNGYCERYDSIKNKIETLENEKNKRKAKEIEIGGFMYELTEYEETITEFDEQLWMMVIDKAIVHQDGRPVFVFRNGCEIEG